MLFLNFDGPPKQSAPVVQASWALAVMGTQEVLELVLSELSTVKSMLVQS